MCACSLQSGFTLLCVCAFLSIHTLTHFLSVCWRWLPVCTVLPSCYVVDMTWQRPRRVFSLQHVKEQSEKMSLSEMSSVVTHAHTHIHTVKCGFSPALCMRWAAVWQQCCPVVFVQHESFLLFTQWCHFLNLYRGLFSPCDAAICHAEVGTRGLKGTLLLFIRI